jgi:predicted anti-sigma-YlaC factor YlaD
MSGRVLEDFEPGELTCQELAELVSDYIEGVLGPSLRDQIVEHLAECADCSSYVEQMHTTIAVTGEIGDGEIALPARVALLDLFRGWASSP